MDEFDETRVLYLELRKNAGNEIITSESLRICIIAKVVLSTFLQNTHQRSRLEYIKTNMHEIMLWILFTIKHVKTMPNNKQFHAFKSVLPSIKGGRHETHTVVSLNLVWRVGGWSDSENLTMDQTDRGADGETNNLNIQDRFGSDAY